MLVQPAGAHSTGTECRRARPLQLGPRSPYIILSLGECLDRLEGLGDWRTGDENVEITEEAKREIRIIAALREMIIAHRFPGSKSP